MSDNADRLAHLSPEKRLLLQKILQEKARGSGPPPVRPRPAGGGPLPLSFAQRRIWLAEQAAPGSVAYGLPLSLRLRGPLDARALALALGELVRRHEALRTVFREGGGDGEPVQVVLPPAPLVLPVVDLAGLAEDHRERALARVVAAANSRPFDLERGPVLRAMRVRLARGEQALLFDMHHIVSDEWSMGIMVREMAELYDALAAGRPPSLPDPEVQYPDFAVWQREHLGGERLEAQLAFWRARLAGLPPLLELPTDRPRAASAGVAGGRRSRTFAASTGHAVRALAQAEGATLFMTLLAAWQLLLGRHAGTGDVAVGTPVAGRTRPEVEGTLGFFVNTLVMRADLSGDPTVRELLAATREAVLGAHANQDLPFEQLVDELHPERAAGAAPLFQVMFSLQRAAEEAVRLGGVGVEEIDSPDAAVRFDLSMSSGDVAGEMSASIGFRSALFDGATVERMLAQYERVLAAMAADPGGRISAIELLSPGERARVLAEGRGPATPPDPRPVHERFAAQAALTPGAPAVDFAGGSWSYAELDRRSAALAGRLRALGVGPDARAGILLERGPGLVAAVLGILRAGGAYLPLDPAYPDERLRFMLSDAGAAAVVTSAGLAGRVHGVPAVDVETPLPPTPSPARGEG
ncbi:MAG: condensation domain-containing protein, partial [Longimicrobiaceae bacterium]